MSNILSMFGIGYSKQCKEMAAKLQAVYRTQAMVEFDLTGNILDANDNFLNVMGYRRDEVVGQHHRMFVDVDLVNSQKYADFWMGLANGEAKTAEFKRIGKKGREIWIQGTYNPICDAAGRPYKVVKFAIDVTERKREEEVNRGLGRLANALKLCQANVMLVDKDLTIVYFNDTLQKTFFKNETVLKTVMTNFSAAALEGENLSVFPSLLIDVQNQLKTITNTIELDVVIGGLSFGLIASPWLDANDDRLGTVIEWDEKTDRLAKEVKEKAQAQENARVRLALDSVSTNVMIADNDANIIYMNEAVVAMMRNAQSDIRKELPDFDANKLRNANIDVFHKDPSHQRRLLEGLKETYVGKAEIGGRTFTVVANPVDVDGERIGSVVEWTDRTAEVAIEKEIDSIVEAAASGDFTQQISLEDKSGFFATLTTGLNDLISTVEVALNDIIRMLGAMARGDLAERITREYEGSFGIMKADANATADKLTEVITKIRIASEAIGSAANEIAQGNADLSQRTEEQASSLEETASSMEQMTSALKQSADNALRASQLALDTQGKAQLGGEVVNRAVNSMDEINTSSNKISDIIGVIDEIAFQTNLLALNAAVEAARAGEQGRGFAVVAGEVRNLAQRSAGAAKEIKDLIRDSVTKIKDGSSLVNESGKTLSGIVASVENVTAMMREIADASREQTSGIEQVNTAVSQMDEMTQQNAALVEEASAAGESMAEQARSLTQVVHFFSVAAHSEVKIDAASLPGVSTEYGASALVSTSKKTLDIEDTDDEWEDF